MKLLIDQFFHDSNYGVMKFMGYKEGNLIFDRYEKTYGDKWLPLGQRVNLEPGFQAKRFEAGRTRPIPPPA
jgi:hypothetical protein